MKGEINTSSVGCSLVLVLGCQRCRKPVGIIRRKKGQNKSVKLEGEEELQLDTQKDNPHKEGSISLSIQTPLRYETGLLKFHFLFLLSGPNMSTILEQCPACL